MTAPDWLHKQTTATVGGTFFHMVQSPADPWVRSMERQTTFRDAAIAAVGALRDDPGCIEAHLFLASHAKEPHVVYAHLSKAVETGKGLWEPIAAAQDDFAWWGVAATRPYMRALKEFAEWHADCGDDVTAHRLYNQLLSMNPNDNQGIRHIHVALPEEACAPAI